MRECKRKSYDMVGDIKVDGHDMTGYNFRQKIAKIALNIGEFEFFIRPFFLFLTPLQDENIPLIGAPQNTLDLMDLRSTHSQSIS